jgi:hypothetical protein
MTLGILGSNPHPPEVPVIEQGNCTAQEASRLTPQPIAPGLMAIEPHAIQRWENEGGEISPAFQNGRQFS